MTNANILILVVAVYVVGLFALAYFAEREVAKGRGRWTASPTIYTLSLAIYCSAWMFYGAVEYAALSGLEYLAFYIGPTLVLVGWCTILRRLVRIGRQQRASSIADLISSRFGKSSILAGLVTVLAISITVPYIAVQLTYVTHSVGAFVAPSQPDDLSQWLVTSVLAIGLILFTALFGTHNLDVNARHPGLITVVAFEAIVKLVALFAVGVFVIWGLNGGLVETANAIVKEATEQTAWRLQASRWSGLVFVTASAFIALPRMYHVLVVENHNDNHLHTASWAFPSYLLLMALFTMPIAVAGLQWLDASSAPFLYLVSLPLAFDQKELALLSFIGGLSAATSMIIVSSLAVAIMISNHLVAPLWLRFKARSDWQNDLARAIRRTRRQCIMLLITIALAYSMTGDVRQSAAPIALAALLGISQVGPALVAGFYWRGATRLGALTGLSLGMLAWLYCFFVPQLWNGSAIVQQWVAHGPSGITWLRPYALFGSLIDDPFLHALLWSWGLNLVGLLLMSLLSFPKPLERLQASQFLGALDRANSGAAAGSAPSTASALFDLTAQVLGRKTAQELFSDAARRQGRSDMSVTATSQFLVHLETRLAGAVGAATAHKMLQDFSAEIVKPGDYEKGVADRLEPISPSLTTEEIKHDELAKYAARLHVANAKLHELAQQKDAFMQQVGHELREPMFMIRDFAELLDEAEISEETRKRHVRVIIEQTERATRLLDDVLDPSVLESGQLKLDIQETSLFDVIEQALSASDVIGKITIDRERNDERIVLSSDRQRLVQVFVTLFVNAWKHNDHAHPKLSIRVSQDDEDAFVRVSDNGTLLKSSARNTVFEKYIRISDHTQGVGLSLAICREIMTRLYGDISYEPDANGNVYTVRIPLRVQIAEY